MNIENIIGPIIAIVVSLIVAFWKRGSRDLDNLKKDFVKEKERTDLKFETLNKDGCNYVYKLKEENVREFATVENIKEIKDILDKIREDL